MKKRYVEMLHPFQSNTIGDRCTFPCDVADKLIEKGLAKPIGDEDEEGTEEEASDGSEDEEQHEESEASDVDSDQLSEMPYGLLKQLAYKVAAEQGDDLTSDLDDLRAPTLRDYILEHT